MSFKVRIDRVNGRLLKESGIDLFIKREDQIHEKISGNKWRKLKYNLLFAKSHGFSGLLTLGGAYSNHIAAVAAAAKIYNFNSLGLIRGRLHMPLNPTLQLAQDEGMHLKYIDSQKYKALKTLSHKEILKMYGEENYYFIPEGGTNALAIKGCAEIVSYLNDQSFDYICVSIGTAGTIAGIIKGLEGSKKVVGFSSLKGNFANSMLENLLTKYDIPHRNYLISNDYHFGGYARHKKPLIEFINTFKKDHQIQLDPIYTGKMLYGIYDLISKDFFPTGSKILAIHTGGLQGIIGFNQRYGNILT